MDRLRPTDRARALVLDGALADGADVDAVARRVGDALERLGLDTERVTLRDVEVAPCRGCFECWIRTPGICGIRDAGRDLARSLVRARLVAYVTPVTFGGYSSELKKAIDRMICVELPFFTRVEGEVHHRPRYAHHPALLVVGVVREPAAGEERTFHELARRNAVNLQASAFASRVLVRPALASALEPELGDAIAEVLDRAGGRARAASAGGGAR